MELERYESRAPRPRARARKVGPAVWQCAVAQHSTVRYRVEDLVLEIILDTTSPPDPSCLEARRDSLILCRRGRVGVGVLYGFK